MTLLDALNRWLSTRNDAEEAKGAISGRKTAVTLAAAALGGSPAAIKLSSLNSFNDSAFTDLLRTGAKKLNRKPPGEKTLANYRSYLRGILAHNVENRKPQAALAANITAKFDYRPAVGNFEDLPAGIRQVISQIIEWKSPGTLPRREERHRKDTWGDYTAPERRRALTRYAHRLITILGVEDLNLFDLVSRDAFITWRQWDEKYLRSKEPENGRHALHGFAAAANLAICLAVVA